MLSSKKWSLRLERMEPSKRSHWLGWSKYADLDNSLGCSGSRFSKAFLLRAERRAPQKICLFLFLIFRFFLDPNQIPLKSMVCLKGILSILLVNGVDSSVWISPSTRPMRSICPIASVFIFRFNLNRSRWLEFSFLGTFSRRPAELDPAYLASPSPADLRHLFYAYYWDWTFSYTSCWISVNKR